MNNREGSTIGMFKTQIWHYIEKSFKNHNAGILLRPIGIFVLINRDIVLFFLKHLLHFNG